MLIIDSPSNDAYFNIAAEEFLLSKFPEDNILLFYVNAPSIIVGKFQNTLAEVNLRYVQEKHIKVVRRLSGGGAVYHDLGNLNFSFHSLLGDQDFTDFSTFTAPVISLLNKLNIPAVLEGRNDILVEGRKFSGNAKLVKNAKMVQHGTILINSEMEVLAKALQTNPLKFEDKATKSNRSRVINLSEYLPAGTTTNSFKNLFIEEIKLNHPTLNKYTLCTADMQEIQNLVDLKYATWDWNFGFSPDYNFKKAKKIPAGFIEVHMDVHRGVIQKVKIFGDFFASAAIEELEQLLIGVQHQESQIRKLLTSLDLTAYFGKVSMEEIIDIFN